MSALAAPSALPYLPLTRPTIDEETIAGVADVLRSGWITSGPNVKALEAKLSEYCGGRPVRVFNSGTCTMEIALRIAGVGPGHEVITTPWSWVATSHVILEVGARPVFVDIDPVTYNLDPQQLETETRKDIAALIVQHTYGIPCQMAPLSQWAASRSIPVIEDCCHTFGSRYQGRLCGTFGSFAFMSGQWNKPFSTGLGGLLLVHDAEVADRSAHIIATEGHDPGWLKNAVLHAQIVTYRALVRPGSAMLLTSLYRLCNKYGLAIGSSSQGEMKGKMPARYLTTLSPCQVSQGLREMTRIDDHIRHRTRMVAFYQAELPRIGLTPLPSDVAQGLPLLRYPVRVANKQELLDLAARARVEIGSWFEVPLHPAGTQMEWFGYRQGMCPEAEAASREVINLPTHPKVHANAAERTLAFLRKFARPT
jgi:dTDP-4-amino-4,6-dideoxygalactose transaminase